MPVNNDLDDDMRQDEMRVVRVKRYKKRRHRVSQYDYEVGRNLNERQLTVLSGLLILSLVVGIVIVMTIPDPPALLERLSLAIERLPEAIEMLFE
jgi:hypothetical protein